MIEGKRRKMQLTLTSVRYLMESNSHIINPGEKEREAQVGERVTLIKSRRKSTYAKRSALKAMMNAVVSLLRKKERCSLDMHPSSNGLAKNGFDNLFLQRRLTSLNVLLRKSRTDR